MPDRAAAPAERPGWRFDEARTRAGLVEVIRAAVGEIGTHEVPPGSNAGPVLRYGGKPGEPWCALFVSWCYRRSEPPSPFGTLASAWKLEEWARTHGRLLEPGAPLIPGDLVVELREDLHGHAELVVADLGGGWIATVGGNVRGAVRGLVHQRAAFNAFARPFP